jgi:MerR family mercuric resistance operon transcriptional regulator
VKHAQDLGFTLDEICELLSLRATQGARAAEVRRKASGKIEDIDRRIAALHRMRNALAHLVDECSGKGPASGCTILHAIERGFDQSQTVEAPTPGPTHTGRQS